MTSTAYEASRRPTALGPLLAATVLCAFLSFAWWLSSSSDQPSFVNAGLEIASTQLSLGEIWEESAFCHKLVLENRSSDDLKILDFATSCACMAIKPRSLTIPAGESREVQIILDLSARTSAESTLPARDFEAHLVPRVQSHFPQQPGWTIKARVRRALTLTAPHIDCGLIVRGQSPTPCETVATARIPLKSVRPDCDRSLAHVSVSRSDKARDTFDISITPSSIRPAGPFRFDVRLYPETVDSAPLPPTTLRVTGLAIDDIQALPSPVSLGAQPLGVLAEETVLLRSITGRPIQIHGINNAPPDLTIQLLPRQSNTAPCFRLVQRITALGDQSSEISILVGTPNEPQPVLLLVRYYGTRVAESTPGPTNISSRYGSSSAPASVKP